MSFKISTHSNNWFLSMTNGGASLIILPCVGFAKSPLSLSFKQISHAVLLSGKSLITIAFNSPYPRTWVIKELDFINWDNSALKREPSVYAFSHKFSSFTTFKAAIATLQASGFPP